MTHTRVHFNVICVHLRIHINYRAIESRVAMELMWPPVAKLCNPCNASLVLLLWKDQMAPQHQPVEPNLAGDLSSIIESASHADDCAYLVHLFQSCLVYHSEWREEFQYFSSPLKLRVTV